jgi:hypothetical protein
MEYAVLICSFCPFSAEEQNIVEWSGGFVFHGFFRKP